MGESKFFTQFRELRNQTIAWADTTPRDIIDIVPEGMNNSIRWNLGHILVAWDNGIFPKISEHRRVPQSYYDLFRKGTSPYTWTEEPPSYIEIVSRLQAQTEEIILASDGKLNDPIAESFLRVKFVRGMFLFHLREEQHHLDCMKRIRKAALKATSA
ncbi:hypothetical protein FHS18_005307 [Paenibacillus phyllosphaerae]|uniref:DinB-like domain-containing protein n=1 Tax=Paenibacillus phyllosphaerae TaxID=274593 RepID=A0A7W5FQM6_9BACL|nr:DinB family protein [Paenibacillus phyllosphaerae]MBB3113204.1 hypothetical protein [Paenibacillus phyllosphaerae]